MVLVEGDLRDRDMVAALAVANKMLASIADPSDRSLQASSALENQRILRVSRDFAAEPSPNVARDHAHSVVWNLENSFTKVAPDGVDTLAACRKRKMATGLVPFADGTA